MNEVLGGQHQPLHQQLSKSRRRQILIALAIGTFMAPLDSSVVNIALPSISQYFHASMATAEWVIMSYLLIISSLLLTYGRMGDLYGHKRIYITGFIIFTLGSLACGLAPSIVLLIFFRALQAIGAGMLMAMGPAIITDVAPPQERGKSMGIIAVSVAVALSTGPVLGGFLVTKFGWSSIFYINIPIGIIASLLAQKVLPDIKGRETQPFDITGAATIFLALITLLLPLSYAEKVGWVNPYIIGGLILGAILLGMFIYLENRIEYPMVDLTLFKNRLFSMSNLSALFNYMSMFSVILIMPFYLQDLRGWNPSHAGLMLISMPLTTMIVAPISGAASDRIDSRYISSIGMFITTIGLWLLSNLQVNSSVTFIVLALAVVGLGSGMFQTPNNSAIMGAVPVNRRGIASSMLGTMRNLGMVLGVAVSGAIFTSHKSYLTKSLVTTGLSSAEVKVQAFVGAIHLTYLVAALIAAVAVVTSLVRGSTKQS